MFFSVNPLCGLSCSELCWKQVKRTDKVINRKVFIRDETKFFCLIYKEKYVNK